MIASGIKKEEYREMTKHWTSRIWNHRYEITEIVFTDYRRQMMFRCEGVTIGQPKPEWTFNPNRTVFVLHLGERLQ
jgi:hypothetical protein